MFNANLYFVTVTILVLAINVVLAAIWRSTSSSTIKFFPLEFVQTGIMVLGATLWTAIPENWAWLNNQNPSIWGWYVGIYFLLQIIGSVVIFAWLPRKKS